MIRFLAVGFALFCGFLSAQPVPLARDAGLAEILSFERGETNQLPNGWNSSTRDSVGFDSETVHRGSGALRLHPREAKPNLPSVVLIRLPVDFTGSRIELRGFLKTEEVSEFAGLWLRLDADPGVTVGFDNMIRQQLKGTTDWKEYTIAVPINPQAKFVYAGVLLAGSGKAWADDLQLLVDGKPIWELPVVEPVLTALDKDQEFDRGSQIVAPSLTPAQITNLAALAKVWGFLKYHHPRVTAGVYHWDYELFRIMPAVLAAPDREALVSTLLAWIDRLGGADSLASEETLIRDVHLAPQQVWLEDPILSDLRVASKLETLRADQTVRKSQFFVSLAPGVGNPQFQNEPSYPRIAYPDPGYQLLALFRYWNIIRYWFPYRDLVDGDWTAILAEFIPRIGLAPDAETYKRELLAFTTRIADTHANLWNVLSSRPPTGGGQLPVVIRMVGNQPVVASVVPIEGVPTPAFQPGDIVTAIDRVPIAELFRAWAPYYAASNEAKRLLDISRSMFIGPTGPVRVEVRRGQDVLTVEAERLPMRAIPREAMRMWHDLPGPAFRLLSPDIAYLKLSDVAVTDIPKYLEQAAGTKGWIIDIRNYPSAFVVFALGQHLVREPTPFARFTVGSLAQPGTFSYGSPVGLIPASPHYSGRVIILVDEVSLSQAEYTSMAFRVASKAVVVGSTTAGADGNLSNFNLPGGIPTGISGIGVFYPDKRPTQRIGIVPDVEAKPTVEGIRDGRDEVLEEGVRQILGPEVSQDEVRRLVPKDV